MPNKCTRCGKIHPDNADYLLRGCDQCHSKFFFYVKPELLGKVDQNLKSLSERQIDEIEKDVREIISEEGIEQTDDETVVLDFEAINVIQPGKYEIDIVNLFNQKPIVIRVGTGKYEIDLSMLAEKWKFKSAKSQKK